MSSKVGPTAPFTEYHWLSDGSHFCVQFRVTAAKPELCFTGQAAGTCDSAGYTLSKGDFNPMHSTPSPFNYTLWDKAKVGGINMI